MNDFTKFDEIVVDSWFDQDCLWLRIEGAARDLVDRVKHSIAPVAVAVVMGAAIFAAPADVLASTPTSVTSIAERVVSTEVGRPSNPKSKAEVAKPVAKANTVSTAMPTWASSEILRLKTSIFQLLDQAEAGDLSGISSDILNLAEEVSVFSTPAMSNFEEAIQSSTRVLKANAS